MHQIFSRKTLLSMTLWVGVFSCFLQTQAFACCWPWCCCYHEAPKTTSHKQPLIQHDQQRSDQSSYGTAQSNTAPLLSQKPQLPSLPVLGATSGSTSLISTEHREDVTALKVTPLPPLQQVIQRQDEQPLLLASASASVSLLVSSERVGPEWTDDTFSFHPTTPSQETWSISQTLFGDQALLSLDQDVMPAFTKFSGDKSQKWDIFTAQNEAGLTKLLYKKVVPYALPGTQEDVKKFVTKIKGLWETNPDSISFAFFPKGSFYYFFATQEGRLLYIKIPIIKGQNDTLQSVSSTRASSRAISRVPSPTRKEKEKTEERKDNKTKEKEKAKEKSGSGSDSDH